MVLRKVNLLLPIFMVFSLLVSLTGCSVKQTDDGATKVAKHVMNAPLYAVMAVGAAGTAVGGAIGYGVSKTTDALMGEELYYGETLIGEVEQEQLDTNETYAKFYQYGDYALYKDAANTTYLYLVPKKLLIKSDDISYFKRWAMADIEKRPKISLSGIILPEGVEAEEVMKSLQKDRFGNPVAWGNNTFITIRERRSGWLLSLKRTMILIGDGAATVDMADKNAPIDYIDQIRYYFPKQTQNMDDDNVAKLIVYDPNKQH